MKCKLKNNEFEAIQVTGFENQFADLKRFCGHSIRITYESCYIDDYWLITLEDDLLKRTVTVPNFDYIVKGHFGFTVMPRTDFEELFEADVTNTK